MNWKNTLQNYGLVHRAVHWLTALIVLALLSVGFYMAGMDFTPAKLQVYLLHKSFGLLILFLVAFRVVWRFTNPKVAELETHLPWEKLLARIVHTLLYLVLFLMPLTGWLMSSAGDFPAPFFGLFEMPDLISKDKAAFEFLRNAHGVIAYVIIGAVALHAAGAFKHHFIDRDETLERMAWPRLGFTGGAVLALLAGILLILPLVFNAGNPEPSEQGAIPAVSEEKIASPWAIDHGKSFIHFAATQRNETFTGAFRVFDGRILFNPEDLANARVSIDIDIASIETGSGERDGQARGEDWFAAAKYPKAKFEAESFTHIEANRYVADGTLTIRGVTMPLSLPFSLTINDAGTGGAQAVMDAEITLNRQDFGVGQGQWKTAETIGAPVKVTIHVEATEAPSPGP